MNKHRYFTKQLHHFKCGTCDMWWSIENYTDDGEGLYCPHCGYYADMETIDDDGETEGG